MTRLLFVLADLNWPSAQNGRGAFDDAGHADLACQLLERSCITQSLTAVQWALQRLHRKHEQGSAPRLEINLM
jgi:hypothetical protein